LKRAATLIVAGLALALAFPVGVAATTNEPIAQTGGMETTFTLLGTPLTVGVSLDATGNISGVTLNPSGTVTQTSADQDQVSFQNTDGTVKVQVRASGSRMTIAARATLAGLVGPGSWSADVFGTGTKSSVPYAVGDDGSGHPTLAIGTIVAAPGITATLAGPTTGSHDGSSFAAATVTFARDGYVKRLSIRVSVDDEGDATLKLTLSGKDRQKLSGTLADLAGSRTWTAHLCDGTPVGVAYHLTVDGNLVFDGATGAPATSRDIPARVGWQDTNGDGAHSQGGDHRSDSAKSPAVDGFKVRFTDTKVSFTAMLLRRPDGTYTLVTKGRSGHCGHQHDGHSGDRGGFGSGSDQPTSFNDGRSRRSGGDDGHD